MKLGSTMLNNLKFMSIMAVLSLSACAPEVSQPEPDPTPSAGPQGPQGAPGTPAPTPTPTVEAEPVTLEGYYPLKNGGYIDIYDDAQGMYTVRAARIVVTNKDQSTGVLPIASITSTSAISGKLYYNSNQTYVAVTHNVQQDSNNANLVGSYLTELIIYKTDEGQMRIKVIVNSATGVLHESLVTE